MVVLQGPFLAQLATTHPQIQGRVHPQIIQGDSPRSRTLPRSSPRNFPCRAEVDENALLIILQCIYVLLERSPRPGRRCPQQTSFHRTNVYSL